MRRWVFILVSLLVTGAACAAEQGFYGGLNVRPNAPESSPFALGDLPSAWTKLTPGLKSETAGGALLYGGYRFHATPLGVEAALSNTADANPVGLRLDPMALGFHPSEPLPRNWNIDLFTNLAVKPNLALYGRMGYGYNDALRSGNVSGASTIATQDLPRKTRDGFNYGVGFRYDMNQSLGLRLEWSRFARFGNDLSTTNQPPESDQLSVGVQYRF